MQSSQDFACKYLHFLRTFRDSTDAMASQLRNGTPPEINIGTITSGLTSINSASKITLNSIKDTEARYMESVPESKSLNAMVGEFCTNMERLLTSRIVALKLIGEVPGYEEGFRLLAHDFREKCNTFKDSADEHVMKIIQSIKDVDDIAAAPTQEAPNNARGSQERSGSQSPRR